MDFGRDIIAIGTTNGKILMYSLASANIEAQLEGGHKSYAVTGLSWLPGTSLYSCGDTTIAEWNIEGKGMKSQWKAGTEKLVCVQVSPDSLWVLSASNSIKLWDAKSHELKRVFSGHAQSVTSLTFVPKSTPKGDFYFLSTAKGDRYINVWSLSKTSSDKSAVVAMVVESEPSGPLSLLSGDDSGTLSLAAVTQSGVVQIFSHQLNGRCSKPLKPLVTLQVAINSARGKESVEPLPVVSAAFSFKKEIRIAYGVGTFLTFENVVLSFDEKLQVLVREDPRKKHVKSSSDTAQVKTPDTQNAQYLPLSEVNAVVSGVKRSHKGTAEVPMEDRLENLSLSMARTDDRPQLPRADNLAQLMLQALHSKDKAILNTVLLKREEDVIRNTVRRLPLQVIEPLLKELTSLLHAKTPTAEAGVRWLRIVLSIHAAHLMANPSLVELLAPVIGLIESRLSLLPSLSRLSGRLELLASQLDGSCGSEDKTTSLAMQTGLLTYQDADTSDEEDMEDDNGGLGSESDDHWEELSDSNASSGREEDDDNDDNDIEDIEISD